MLSDFKSSLKGFRRGSKGLIGLEEWRGRPHEFVGSWGGEGSLKARRFQNCMFRIAFSELHFKMVSKLFQKIKIGSKRFEKV